MVLEIQLTHRTQDYCGRDGLVNTGGGGGANYGLTAGIRVVMVVWCGYDFISNLTK